MLSGDNGILQRATDAKTNTDNAQIKERIQLAYHSALTKDITGENGELTMETLQGELNNEFVGKTVTITPSADNKKWTIKVDNVEETVPAGKDDTPQVATLPSAEGTTPYFPSDSFSQVDGTDLSTGLVITDEVDDEGNSTGNEYVWIEVPRTATTYGSSFNLNYDFDNMTEEQKNTAYTAIATALRNYVSDIISIGTTSDSPTTTTYGYTDEWYDGCGITNENAYTNLYNEMLQSVYKNGGFWIGRYEAGQTTARTNSSDSIDGLVPLSKIDQIPIMYVTCSQAQTIAGRVQNIDTTKYKSSLMFGIQWDLVLKYLNRKGVSVSNLTSDSKNWGNYSGVEFEVTKGKIWNFANYSAGFVEINESFTHPQSGAPVLFSTGITSRNELKKIYDLAGNIEEFTLEKTSVTLNNQFCCIRGGNYVNTGAIPASNRNCVAPTSSSSNMHGFRVSIY